jgi:hypothetical protein
MGTDAVKLETLGGGGIACQPFRRNFHGFNFRAFSTSRPHPRQSIAYMTTHVFSANLRFSDSYFRGTQPIRKK